MCVSWTEAPHGIRRHKASTKPATYASEGSCIPQARQCGPTSQPSPICKDKGKNINSEMKVNFKNNYLLAACVLVLLLVCWMSVSAPIRFEREQGQRETAVKERLMAIRKAEEQYRKRHGTYTGDWQTLIRNGFLADSLQYVPYTDKHRFSLAATTTIGKSGRQIPLMECGVTYDVYLQGLDQHTVSSLTADANEAGRYPGLKIGDISEPNGNRGNWE